MIRTLIVDDEELARQNIRYRLEGERDVEIVGEAADGLSAVRAMRKLAPDLIFLDVRMPQFGGFEILERSRPTRCPFVIFVTAYEQYAAKAFETHAVDYILKPISQSRFQEALQRARSEISRSEPVGADSAIDKDHVLESPDKDAVSRPKAGDHGADLGPLRRLTVKVRDRFVLVRTDEVDWFESAGNYVRLHARSNSFLLRMTMDELEARLDMLQFARVHRSTIVNIDRIAEIRPTIHGDFEILLRDNTTLRLSRGYRGRLLP